MALCVYFYKTVSDDGINRKSPEEYTRVDIRRDFFWWNMNKVGRFQIFFILLCFLNLLFVSQAGLRHII